MIILLKKDSLRRTRQDSSSAAAVTTSSEDLHEDVQSTCSSYSSPVIEEFEFKVRDFI